MSFYNFIRDLFDFTGQRQPPTYGFQDQWRHADEFRNPIWQTDEDDYDDNDDFRQPGQRGDFVFGHLDLYGDPLELTRYFEKQMDNVLKNIFGFGSNITMSPLDDSAGYDLRHPLPAQQGQPESLRDEVLKPGYQSPKIDGDPLSCQEKLDVDLDGEINGNELSKFWEGPSAMYTDTRLPLFRGFGQTISTKIIRKSDGSVEQYRTIRDSRGNEETTVTRQIGDETRTVVTRKDENGEKTETEIVNSIDRPEITSEKPLLSGTADPMIPQNPLNRFPWHKFFGHDPKL